MIAVEAEQPFLVVAVGAAPGQVKGVGFGTGRALPVVVVDRIGIAHAAFKAVVAGAQGQFVPGVEAVVAAQAEGLADPGVIQAAEALVLGLGGRQAYPGVVGTAVPAGPQIGDAMVADVHVAGAPALLMAVLGDDVDHPQEGVGTKGIGVGAAHHLDAFDLVDGQGQG